MTGRYSVHRRTSAFTKVPHTPMDWIPQWIVYPNGFSANDTPMDWIPQWIVYPNGFSANERDRQVDTHTRQIYKHRVETDARMF